MLAAAGPLLLHLVSPTPPFCLHDTKSIIHRLSLVLLPFESNVFLRKNLKKALEKPPSPQHGPIYYQSRLLGKLTLGIFHTLDFKIMAISLQLIDAWGLSICGKMAPWCWCGMDLGPCPVPPTTARWLHFHFLETFPLICKERSFEWLTPCFCEEGLSMELGSEWAPLKRQIPAPYLDEYHCHSDPSPAHVCFVLSPFVLWKHVC